MKWVKIFDSKESAFNSLEENKPFTVSINNLKICLVRTVSGIAAFKSQCPHAGASLSNGFVNAHNEVVCPMHGYRFDLMDGREKTGNACELYMYNLELKEDGLFLGLR